MSQSLLALLKRYEKYWLPAILVLAFLLRLPLLDGSFWLDEAAQALESSRPFSLQLDITKDFQPPLYHLWLHLFTYLSHTEWWLRLASLIPGLLTLIITFRFASALYSDRRAPIIASLLLATSQFHVFYSQELRPYALAAFWGMLAIYAWHQLVITQQNHSYLFILAASAGMYTMYVFPVLLCSLLLATLMCFRHHAIAVTKHLFVSALLMLPLLPLLLSQLEVGTTLQASLPGWSSVVSLPLFKALPLTLAKLFFGRILFGLDGPTLLLALTIGLPVLIGLTLGRSSYPKWLLVVVCTSLSIAWLISFVIPVIEPKRLLFLLPLLYLTLTAFIVTHKRGYFALLAILVGNFLSLSLYWQAPVNQREPWREAVQVIETQASSDSVVVFAFPEPFAPWVWYQQKNVSTLTFDSVPLTKDIPEGKESYIQKSDQVVVFEYLMDLTDPDRLIHAYLKNHQYQEIDILTYPNLGQIRIFAKKPIYALQP